MGKTRRGNYIFVTWFGDHGHHVHVFRNTKLVVKWDLDEKRVMEGRISRRILKLITELQKLGRL